MGLSQKIHDHYIGLNLGEEEVSINSCKREHGTGEAKKNDPIKGVALISGLKFVDMPTA